MSHSDPTGALFLGTGAGVWIFFKGFRVFREFKIVADTPRMPIRSVSMGLVQVRGTALSDKLIPSPVTCTPCCFYQVKIERYETGEHGGWKHHCTDMDGAKFYLQDKTGKVLIDSYSAAGQSDARAGKAGPAGVQPRDSAGDGGWDNRSRKYSGCDS